MITPFVAMVIFLLFLILMYVVLRYEKFGNIAETFNEISNEAVQNISSIYTTSGVLTVPSLLIPPTGTLNTPSLTVSNLNVTPGGSFNLIPRGVIVSYYGDRASVPSGWAICDGSFGTPDLRGRFILGVNDDIQSPSGLSVRKMNSIGGEEMHKLTIDEMPSHSHKYTNPYGRCTRCHSGSALGGTGDTSSPTGGDKPHNNMPPYYVMMFIMKL